MAISTKGLPFGKGLSRKILKRKARAAEAAVIQAVRTEVVDRDGYCRLYWHDAEMRRLVAELFGPCEGPSEWAHFGERKRSLTMRMAPEHRHDRKWSLMLCHRHHDMYDHTGLDLEALTRSVCDGRLRLIASSTQWLDEP